MSSSCHYCTQRHTRHKKRPGFCGNTGVVPERGEESSPVAVTATGKKQALTRPSFSTGEPSHVACCSDSQTDFQCEMKGLWFIDLESLLASISRRASCNVCGLLLTVREDLKLKKGICSRQSLSCTNLLCAGSNDAFCDPSKYSKALNSRFHLAGRMCGRGRAGLEAISLFLGVLGWRPSLGSWVCLSH